MAMFFRMMLQIFKAPSRERGSPNWPSGWCAGDLSTARSYSIANRKESEKFASGNLKFTSYIGRRS